MNTSRRTLRWVIAHHPARLFVRTAEKFRLELEKECPGEFDIEIYTMSTYQNKYNNHPEFSLIPPNLTGLEEMQKEWVAMDGKKIQLVEVDQWSDIKTKWQGLFNGLRQGDFEITQTQVTIIGAHLDRNFHAIDLPFLFDDHDHVSRVLDGEIGDALCAGLSEKADIRGLAFTYSGGYRVIGTKEAVTNLSELAETHLLTHTAHSDQLFQGVGANTITKHKSDISDLADIAGKNNGAVETTYLRFSGKHVYKTEHSMFTTTILTGNSFWNTLTPKQQASFLKIAKIVAIAEREWSVADAEKYEADALAAGISIADISEEDRAKLKLASQSVYANLDKFGIDADLVNQIIDKKTLH